MQLLSTNVIYGIVAYAFMIPAEKFFKKMFGFDKAATPGALGSPAAGMMAMRGLDKIGGFGPHGKGKGGKAGAGDSSGRSKINFAKNKLGTPMDSVGGENSAKTSGKGANSAVVNLGGKSAGDVPKSGGDSTGRKGGKFGGARRYRVCRSGRSRCSRQRLPFLAFAAPCYLSRPARWRMMP